MKIAWLCQLTRKMSTKPSLRRRWRTRPGVEAMERRLLLYHTFVGNGDSDAVWSFTDLSYSYSNLRDGWNSGSMTDAEITGAVEEAMGVWTAVTPLKITEQNDSGPLDGSGRPRVDDAPYDPIGHPFFRWGHHEIAGNRPVAHAEPPSDDGHGGDMHFDDVDRDPAGNPLKQTFGFKEFLEVATHEFGHAIGMAHTTGDVKNGEDPPGSPDIMNAVIEGGLDSKGKPMWSFSGPGSAYLSLDDIAGAQSLYGSGLGYVLNGSGELNVYGTGGSDTMLIRTSGGSLTVSSNGRSFTRSLSGLRSIHLHGQGGKDFLRVEGDGGLPTTLDGGPGDDHFDMSSYARNLSNITGHVNVRGGDGTDGIFIYDNNNGRASTYTVDSSGAYRAGFGGMSYDSKVEVLTLVAGAGADTINIPSTSPGTSIFINNATGRDTVNILDTYGRSNTVNILSTEVRDAIGKRFGLSPKSGIVYDLDNMTPVGSGISSLVADVAGSVFALNPVSGLVYQHNVGAGWSWNTVGSGISSLVADVAGSVFAVTSTNGIRYKHVLGSSSTWIRN